MSATPSRRELSEVVDLDVYKEACRKMNLRRQFTEIANSKFTDTTDRETFVNKWAPTLTTEEVESLRIAELMAAVDPTR